jgi:hypothetical protein
VFGLEIRDLIQQAAKGVLTRAKRCMRGGVRGLRAAAGTGTGATVITIVATSRGQQNQGQQGRASSQMHFMGLLVRAASTRAVNF